MSTTATSRVEQDPGRIAVVGLGCRFPGSVHSPEDFWDFLLSGRDARGEVPPERWQAYESSGPAFTAALREAPRQGYYLDDISGFDAAFFGLSPREAELMDPQQRILLHVVWEALENAGIPPESLGGSCTGVYVGVGSDDYGRRLLEDLPDIEAWTGIGASMCAAANRISHTLDLRGPSMSVDTACSSSLVTLHLACQSLRSGESDLALAGGVNLVVSPGLNLTLGAAGALAPDGRSKSFDATADGYGRGEGAGMVILKRYADAVRDGDRVLATVLGSAVRQDGHTNGIMAPDGQAQQALMEAACRNADVDPGSVSYVEAHGTGTRRGDPLEAHALSSVYGHGRDNDSPCLVGSVKSNIGHLEAGAGVAGIIKTVLSLRHGRIPGTLHHTRGNPDVDWENSGLRVVDHTTAWPESRLPHRAGVSGFGYGGTIAHVLLEQVPDTEGAKEETAAGPAVYPLSARSEEALAEHAGALALWLERDDTVSDLTSFGHTLARGRSHLKYRAAVVADGREELTEGLRSLSENGTWPGLVSGQRRERAHGPVWVFSGHGSHWLGMGRELLESEPAFRTTVERIDPVFTSELGDSPLRLLREGGFDAVHLAQPMIFTMHVGLAAVWRHYGVEPAAVIGHSVGEIAAAVAADALTLEEGALLICRRSLLLRRVAGRGAMAMVGLPFQDVAERLSESSEVVPAIAASPVSTVVSGTPEAVESLMARWSTQGVGVRRVDSDVAFHSPQMDPLLADLESAVDGLSPLTPSLRVYSTANDDPRRVPSFDGAYWARNLRSPVNLEGAVRAAVEDGFEDFLEVSAHPVVTHSIGETMEDMGVDGARTGWTLRRGLPERKTLLSSLAFAHCEGTELDWRRLHPGGSVVDLPHNAWQERSHWHEANVGTGTPGHAPETHTLLGARLSVAGDGTDLWRTVLDHDSRPYPGSHAINGAEIMPAAAILSTFAAAARHTVASGALTELGLRIPLWVGAAREVQVVHEGGALRLASRPEGDDGDWVIHATATTDPGCAEPASPAPEREDLAPDDPAGPRAYLASVGVTRMAYDWDVEELLSAPGALSALVTFSSSPESADGWAPVFDAALSLAPTVFDGPARLRMVTAIGSARCWGPAPDRVRVRVEQCEDNEHVDVTVLDEAGAVRARLGPVRYQEGGRPHRSAEETLHELWWTPWEPTARATPTVRHTVVLDPSGSPLATRLAKVLADRQGGCALVRDVEQVEVLDASTDLLLVPGELGPEESVPEAAARAGTELIDAVRAVASLDLMRFPRLWCVTSGIRECAELESSAQASLWGVGRVVASEHAELWGGVLDVPVSGPEAVAAPLDTVLNGSSAGEVVSLDEAGAHVARLRRRDRVGKGQGLVCRPDSTYLVTGGLGALGLKVAAHLVDRGACRLVLAGRRGLPPRSQWDSVDDSHLRERVEAVRALERRGATVRVMALDIADEETTARELAPERLGMPPVRGVVHAAGVLDNRMAAHVDEASLRDVMRPKVDGAWVLHRVFPPGSLDFLALFSSCGHLLGLPGQTAYGAGNAFLDAIAAHRSEAGDTLSLGWTSWRGRGMADNAAVDAELRARGVDSITEEEAFEAWDLAVRRGPGHVVVLAEETSEEDAEHPPLLSGTFPERSSDPRTQDTAPALDRMTPQQRRDHVHSEVMARISESMKLSESSLDSGRSLAEQGMDSVMTISLRRSLERGFGQPLPASLLWQQPTIDRITEHLCALLDEA